MEDALGSAGPHGVSATTDLAVPFVLLVFFVAAPVQFLVQLFTGGCKFSSRWGWHNVYVEEELSCVPRKVQLTVVLRSWAKFLRIHAIADALDKKIVDAGYRMIYLQDEGEEVLAQMYRIRLRGIDAPEYAMPYGKEAKEALVEIVQGKRLRVLVYNVDPYGRFVADVHCKGGGFMQELMLKKGFAWHYTDYDQRQELGRWEKQAREMRIGLWASPYPEKPWEWRKKHRQQRQRQVLTYPVFD